VPEGADGLGHHEAGANDPEGAAFGEAASSVYNVIDARQAYLQKVVAAGLRALGHAGAAERSIHLSYEIVALTPRCAAEMGYELTSEEAKKPYVEVSGRKGFEGESRRLAGQAGGRDARGSAAAACGDEGGGTEIDGA